MGLSSLTPGRDLLHDEDMAGETGLDRRDSLPQTLGTFAKVLVQGYEITDVLHDVAEQTNLALGVAGAGVSLLHGDRIAFATAGSEALAGLERTQEELQHGPCLDAAKTNEIILIEDLADFDSRWPAYVARAGALGIHAMAVVPMGVDDSSLGAVTLYDTSPRAWSHADIETARIFADIATSYLINASKLDQQRRLAEQLQKALDSRVVIEQAKGIIASDQSISVDEAFRRLRKHANDHHAGLHATADAVVNLGLRP